MKKIGLTGSIGAGKSTVTGWLRAKGIAVHDADMAVHEIYQDADVLAWLQKNFPGSVSDGKIDRMVLSDAIFSDEHKKQILHNYIHPKVREHRDAFVRQVIDKGEGMIVLDIPLLFETQRKQEFDEVWLVTAPEDIRLARALTRADMTIEKFTRIDGAQMPEADKRVRADVIIDNSGDMDALHQRLAELVECLNGPA